MTVNVIGARAVYYTWHVPILNEKITVDDGNYVIFEKNLAYFAYTFRMI